MKLPVRLIWDIIGDSFGRIFVDEQRRPIEAIWQGQSQMAGDIVSYLDAHEKMKSPFYADVYVPWGSYPSIPYLIDVADSTRGVVVGESGGAWVIYTPESSEPPSQGYMGFFGGSSQYDSIESSKLLSGGYAHFIRGVNLATNAPYSEDENPSYNFGPDTTFDGSGRWLAQGSSAPSASSSGLGYSLNGVNWGVLKDQYHMDASSGWKQVWRLKITKWDTNPSTRAISINSLGDVGADYELRLTNTNNEVSVRYGVFAKTYNKTLTFNGDTITRTGGSFISDGFFDGLNIVVTGTPADGAYTIHSVTAHEIKLTTSPFSVATTTPKATLASELTPATGDTSSWYNKLVAATEDNPLYIEFVIEYVASTASIHGSVYLDNESVEQDSEYKVMPGRRWHVIDVLNQANDISVELDFLACPTGILWESEAGSNFSASLDDTFAYSYEVDEPVVDAEMLSSEPWDLAPPAEVVDATSTHITVDIHEDWNNYAPEYCRILHGDEWIFGEKISHDGDRVKYYIIMKSSSTHAYEGEVRVHPWFLYSDEFEFTGSGRVSTSYEIPFASTDRAWFIGANAEESRLYDRFGKLVGLPKRLDSKKYLDTIRGASYMLRAPFTPNHASRGIGAMFGMPYVLEPGVIESIKRVRDPRTGESLYDRVVVGGKFYDIDTYWDDQGLVKPVGTLLEFMGSIVVGPRVADWKSDIDLVQKLVDNKWKTWGTFAIQIPSTIGISRDDAKDLVKILNKTKSVHTDFLVEYTSDVSEDLSKSNYATESQVSYAHAIEDMMFDDDGTVVMNPMSYQTVGGEMYSEEYQHPYSTSMPGGSLDGSVSLDGPTAQNPKLVLDNHKFPDEHRENYYPNSGIDLKRDLSVLEKHFSRTPLRVRGLNQGDYRPYDLLWLENADGTPLSYHTQRFEDATSHAGTTTHGVYMPDRATIYTVGTTDANLVSSDYGYTWSAMTFDSMPNNLYDIHGDWACGDLGYLYQLQAGTWTSISTVAANEWYSVYFIDDDTGWICGEDASTQAICGYTTDGGATWNSSTVAAVKMGQAIRFKTSIEGWMGTDGGVYYSTDGGANWTLESPVFDCKGIAISGDCVIAVGSGGTIYRRSADGAWSLISSPVATNLNGVSFHNDTYGWIVGNGGTALRTKDGGLTWSIKSAGTNDMNAVYSHDQIGYASIGGASQLYRWM